MSLPTVFFAALLVFVSSASIPLSVRQAASSQSFSLSPSPPSPPTSESSSSAIPVAANQLAAQTTPSPSPSPLQSQLESPPGVIQLVAAPLPSAQAPSSVGKFLGRVGVETPEFRWKCLQCCRHTVRDYSNVFPVVRSCQCALNENLAPPNSGNCKQGATLGFALTPTNCFYDRCHKMLQSRSNSCMCLG